MTANFDIEQTKVIDHLTAALSSSLNMKRDLLSYLIDMALTEARVASEPPKVVLRRPGQPRKRIM